MKTFLIEDFLHLPPVSRTPVVYLELRISLQIFGQKFETALTVYRGNRFMTKPESQKSRGTVSLRRCEDLFCTAWI
jgi:hypothetical protein